MNSNPCLVQAFSTLPKVIQNAYTPQIARTVYTLVTVFFFLCYKKSGPRKKAEALLDLILSRGPHAFEALYKSALDARLFDAADILHPDLKPHGTTVNKTY